MIFANRFPVLFTIAVAIAGVSAQSLDDCGQTCVNNTLTKGYCSSVNDTSCVCTNTQFQSALASCLSSNCSSSDLTIAQQIQEATCSSVSSSSTSAKASASASGTNSATPSASTTSNGASAVEQLPLLSAVIAIAGALMGGAFVL